LDLQNIQKREKYLIYHGRTILNIKNEYKTILKDLKVSLNDQALPLPDYDFRFIGQAYLNC
jgi:hypothetical protein